ncbi:uncharacterized protein LOC122537417 isoform X2 [Frieseomelitta varia]|uniref:uncharacterized protein LOC122537417 isoform X2 n=1 Tax=Frieseomelitta varia TaxID=561572 RepID=UPI001CB69625|nr:uncharacterized protein LOC122537417 isoform X2 [Frieseomelitta varia]
MPYQNNSTAIRGKEKSQQSNVRGHLSLVGGARTIAIATDRIVVFAVYMVKLVRVISVSMYQLLELWINLINTWHLWTDSDTPGTSYRGFFSERNNTTGSSLCACSYVEQ